MANKNDYNYYKSEYSKFKQNNYVPGNNNFNNNDKGRSVKRFFRSFLVFFITFGIIAVAVFGGIKLYNNIVEKKENKPAETTLSMDVTTNENDEKTTTKKAETTAKPTTEKETTTKAPETTKSSSSGKIAAGTVAVVETSDDTGIYLRNNPTYNEYGYALLPDGTTVIISEVSSDGLWAKTSNFDIDGWVYTQYLVPTSSTSVTTSSSSSSSSSSDNSGNLTFGQALTIFGNDTSRNLFMNCRLNSSNVNGIADYQDPASKVIATFSSGQDVEIYSVRSGYGKTRVNGIETWIPTQYLDFVSWGHYR